MILMLLGNVGLVSIMSTVVISLLRADESRFWARAGLMSAGLVLLSLVATSKWIDRRLSSLISWALSRWTDLDTRDYANLLHLADGYGVTEVIVQRGGVLDSTSVVDAGLQKMGLQVLGVQRSDGSYEGAPSPDSILRPGDVVFLYGRNREVSDFCAERAKARSVRNYESGAVAGTSHATRLTGRCKRRTGGEYRRAWARCMSCRTDARGSSRSSSENVHQRA